MVVNLTRTYEKLDRIFAFIHGPDRRPYDPTNMVSEPSSFESERTGRSEKLVWPYHESHGSCAIAGLI